MMTQLWSVMSIFIDRMPTVSLSVGDLLLVEKQKACFFPTKILFVRFPKSLLKHALILLGFDEK